MSLAHSLAYCEEAVCVAEDTAVSFFAPLTLKKFRVERFKGLRIVGIYIKEIKKKFFLHAIDAEGNWFVVSLDNIELVSSSTLPLSSIKDTPKNKKISNSVLDSSNDNRSGILQAHFHEYENHLHAVVLTQEGIFSVALGNNGTAQGKPKKLLDLESGAVNLLMSTSKHSGLVVVGEKGDQWLQYVLLEDKIERDDSEEGLEDSKLITGRHKLPIILQSVCCNPTDLGVAIGGGRGELMVYPNIYTNHFFSDHWHHTPLSAIRFSIDGSSLFTGAMESTMLVWNLQSFTHKKIQLNIGKIRSIITSESTGSQLLIASNTSTLGVVNLLQRQLSTFADGIEWQSEHACSGLIVEQWMGKKVVILTGLPNVLRICDPLTHQSIYSLNITTEMEVLANPPTHGIRFARMLREGRIIVTYENFAGSSLPPMLRFWTYDPNQRRHVESQTIYSPHQSDVLDLQVDKANDRVFTLSRDSIKCWEEVMVDVNDALNGESNFGSWRNSSTLPSPSKRAQSLLVSGDGSLCFVADDSVHVYSLRECRPGQKWPHLLTLYQDRTTEALHKLNLIESEKVLVAFEGVHVLIWDLTSEQVKVFSHQAPVTALCLFTSKSVLFADNKGTLVELGISVENSGIKLGEVQDALTSKILHMELLSASEKRVAVVDALSGFRALNVSIEQKSLHQKEINNADPNTARQTAAAGLQQYFQEREVTATEKDANSTLESQRIASTNLWLKSVLEDSAYAVAPQSIVFSQYMKKMMN